MNLTEQFCLDKCASIVHQQRSNAHFYLIILWMPCLPAERTVNDNGCETFLLSWAAHSPRIMPGVSDAGQRQLNYDGIANLLMLRGRVMLIVFVQFISNICMPIASQNAKEALGIAILLMSRGCTHA